MNIQLKSVYQKAEPLDGCRYLVETLWPEECQSTDLTPCEWIHEICPSYTLQLHAQDGKWDAKKFESTYHTELASRWNAHLLNKLRQEASQGTVTLLYASTEVPVAAECLKSFLLKN